MSGPDEPLRDPGEPAPSKGRACPLCGKPMSAEFKPFCSKRCADVDLHRWLNGVYALPAAEDDEPSDDE